MKWRSPHVRARSLGALALCALAVNGCGSGGATGDSVPVTTAAVTQPADPTPEEVLDTIRPLNTGQRLLRGWTETIVPTLITARDRAKAFEAGEATEAARLERRYTRQLRKIRKFGAQARSAFVGQPDSRVKGRVTAAGDAWTAWAYEQLVNPAAGDFEQARAIADLAAVAINKTRRAYRAIDEPIPPVWRRG